jgi:ABC-type branched-subunit amino acid transport system substrate-binding protein
MKSRAVLFAAMLMLLLAACGARLTREQRLAGIGSVTVGTPGADGVVDPGSTTAPGAGGTTGPGAGGTTGPGAGGGGVPAPPGGNGGATDTGVTATSITLAVASDLSGVQGGLFRTTHQAMSAWAAMINSQGGLFGRRVNLKLRDTQARDTSNAAVVSDSCRDSFALVGSMSAFDGGGASAGEACGIPDITAITVNDKRSKASNVYPVYPVRADKIPIGPANYIKEKYPDVIDHAAMVYLNAGVTKANALQRVKAYETVGFKFKIYEVQVLEANYTPTVQRMKEDGVEYVTMVANYQSIQKLVAAMDQQNWFPKVRDWDSVAYAQNFLTCSGSPCAGTDGSNIFMNITMNEEAAGNPELQLYQQWLSRVAPGAKPDYFGFYAWSAGQLFAKVHKDVGAKITRKAFLAGLKNVHSWNGNGLHAAHDIGAKIMSPCFMYIEVRSNKFARKDPASSFMCNKGPVINT